MPSTLNQLLIISINFLWQSVQHLDSGIPLRSQGIGQRIQPLGHCEMAEDPIPTLKLKLFRCVRHVWDYCRGGAKGKVCVFKNIYKKQIQYIQSYITSVRIMMKCDELHRPLLWATFLLSSSRFSRRSVCWSYSAMRDCQGWSSMQLSSPSRTPLDLSKDGGYNLIQPYTTHISWIYSAFTIIYDHIHGENDDINSIPRGDQRRAQVSMGSAAWDSVICCRIFRESAL